MKILLFTSALTFVPDNYDDFVIAMLEHPQIAGLVVDDNREDTYLMKAAALIISGAAPRFGWQIWKNRFGSSLLRREEACRKNGKTYRLVKGLNSAPVVQMLRDENVDLVLNARTRTFFRKDLLAAPRFGCLNIHHGLLPDQRGLMCDFWSQLDEVASGFSVHVMTAKLDDGPVLRAVEVPAEPSDYLATIRKTARKEAEVCAELLSEIAALGRIPAGTPNRSDRAQYRKNPGLTDFYRLHHKGNRL
jgi:hypothetical protein